MIAWSAAGKVVDRTSCRSSLHHVRGAVEIVI
jgi:hypothetical protein